MRTETVTSARNPRIKELLALQEKSRLRRDKGLFTVEGRRELGHCAEAGFRIRDLFICREICPDSELERILDLIAASAGGSASMPGIIAEVEYKERTLGSLDIGDNPLIAVLEGVEKPGNLGAVLRSADSCGADAVIVCDPLTDIYNPNLIRASIGAVFTVPVVAAGSEETIAWLKDRNIQILTAQLQDSGLYYDTDMTGGTAIVMGTEATGLTEIWRRNADRHIRIPMLGKLDSLNVSVSAAILLYEAVRQRNQR